MKEISYQEEWINKFIDIDNKDHCVYNNLFIKENNFVVKIPLGKSMSEQAEIKIEKFNLANHTFLLSY